MAMVQFDFAFDDVYRVADEFGYSGELVFKINAVVDHYDFEIG